MSELEIWKIYRNSYNGEPFVRFIRDKKGLYKFPDPKFLIGSNFCDIGFDIDEYNQRLVSLSASDNLIKGARICNPKHERNAMDSTRRKD